jgi:non-LEE-encoded effector NleA
MPAFPSPFVSLPPIAAAPAGIMPAAASGAPAAPAATVVTISGSEAHVIAMPDEIGAADAKPEIKGLFAALRDKGFMQTMTDLVAPYMEEGSCARRSVDALGLFNVNQAALEIPTGAFGSSGKYGIQVNIVKPDIYPHDANYYLQLFPIHDEIGFNLTQPVAALLPRDCLPAWCGLSAQIIRNHGFNLPIYHGPSGWKLGGPANGAEYLEEWVVRPLELDLKCLGTPAQATIGLELGMHFKWALNNPQCKWAFASNCASNAMGLTLGAAAAAAGGGNTLLMMQGGAMTAQLAGHGLQCWSDVLRPDEILTWAGATFGAADVNQAAPPAGAGRLTNYPRIWGHVHDGCWRLNDLKKMADAAVAPIAGRAARGTAMELAELGVEGGADNLAYIAEHTAAANGAARHLA